MSKQQAAVHTQVRKKAGSLCHIRWGRLNVWINRADPSSYEGGSNGAIQGTVDRRCCNKKCTPKFVWRRVLKNKSSVPEERSTRMFGWYTRAPGSSVSSQWIAENVMGKRREGCGSNPITDQQKRAAKRRDKHLRMLLIKKIPRDST